jgi:hypothetical protein
VVVDLQEGQSDEVRVCSGRAPRNAGGEDDREDDEQRGTRRA